MTTVQSAIAELQKLPPNASVHVMLITEADIKKQAALRKLDVSKSLLAEFHEILIKNYDSNHRLSIQQIDDALDLVLVKEGLINGIKA